MPCLLTGDLTHAKTANEMVGRQYEDEWRAYRRALDESGVLKRQMPWLDLRGNHGESIASSSHGPWAQLASAEA